MGTWLDRICLLALVLIIALLTATALPALREGPLGGTALLLHMMASGALVFALPLFALLYLSRNLRSDRSGGMQRLGFWLLILSGIITIGSIFLCMLPIPSTDEMHELIRVHRYAGFAMVPAVVLLAIGTSRWRRIQSTRSATPG
ncbi:MAG: hypothetical protein ACR2NZ_03615 [Rubripirellula sp.]